MTDTKNSTQRRWHLVVAAIFFLFSFDGLFGTLKYFFGAACFAIALANLLQGFNLFASRRWLRPLLITLNALAFILVLIDIGSRVVD